MSYVNIDTLEKVESSIIIKSHPDISFPNRAWTDEELLSLGYAELHMPNEQPIPGFYEKLEETSPKKIGDKWYMQFKIVSLSEKEISKKNEMIKNDIIFQTQQRLDNFAQTRGYDSILSLCSYANSTNPKFAKEGSYGIEIRDLTWLKLYEVYDQVISNERPFPKSFLDVVDDLPIYRWPE